MYYGTPLLLRQPGIGCSWVVGTSFFSAQLPACNNNAMIMASVCIIHAPLERDNGGRPFVGFSLLHPPVTCIAKYSVVDY